MAQGICGNKGRPAQGAEGGHFATGAEIRNPYPVISSAALLERRKEIIIEHGTERYRLRITSNNKLILTK